MAEHGMLSSAGKPVYLTMNTEKWPPAINWAHQMILNANKYIIYTKILISFSKNFELIISFFFLEYDLTVKIAT